MAAGGGGAVAASCPQAGWAMTANEASRLSAAGRDQFVPLIAMWQLIFSVSGLGIRAEHPAPELGLLFQLFCESSGFSLMTRPATHDVSATGRPVERPG